MLPDVTTNNSAPNDSDCLIPMQDDDFCVIMELTIEEKRELIELWMSYISNKKNVSC